MRRTVVALTFSASASLVATQAHANAFFLHAGDTVVFLGDSITEGGAYTVPVEDYVVTRYPHMPVRFINSGVGKDKISGGLAGDMRERLDRDVAAFHPTVVTMMFGMNDGGFRSFDPHALDTFTTGYTAALTTLKTVAPHARLTLIRPSPYDDFTRAQWTGGDYNDVLIRYGDQVTHLASQSDATVADLNAPVVSDLRRLAAVQPDVASKLFPDRTHPVPAGGLLLAKALLEAWGATALVSSVDIDARGGVAMSTANAQLRAIARGPALSWDQLDAALPMPLPDDAMSKVVASTTDFTASLNQQILKVTGLPERRIQLSIDGKAVAVLDAADLADGVNLAALATPMTAQAADVHTLTLAHNSLRMTRWRRVQLVKTAAGVAGYKQALSAIDLAEASIVSLQREIAQPQWHHFELKPL
ncbi:SGNH/GDSL hydrolase family protein [Paraburkholderia sp.]|uniref:SGNH/GDSL hydrolase family protein n=1 Tax=Paraburkholderia sp. TaxID=1926495 RepID=UPI002391011A|nr:SGNH/GDSL hydrolase family protein [Paraburkholderia sp.]MDE1180164.1 SGNH/GDSL hydrolase family protein [Paraburkholderia sp.]